MSVPIHDLLDNSLVGLVLASHAVQLPPEAEWLGVSVLGVLVSFGVGALVTRIPAVGRFVQR